jgi:DNA replication protein DnaC
MLNQPMMEKLLTMRLQGMVDGLKSQAQDRAANELSFLERLALLVDQQWDWRENQALARRLKAAKLRGPACVEDIDYRTARGLDKSVMRALAKDSGWVRNHENVFVLGPTGVGKSFIALALAQKACRDGHSALYMRAAALLRDLALARADGSLRHLLARLSRIDVLVIDDWAMAPLNESERREIWEICEDRYKARSTVPPSSRLRCQSRAGTNRSAIPPSPTAFWTVWFTTRTASRCAENRCAKNKTLRRMRSRSNSPLLRGRGRGKGLLPLSPAPLSLLESSFASLRTISLDDSEHLLHNHHASVASLRLLFSFLPERRSASLRKQCSPSPEYPPFDNFRKSAAVWPSIPCSPLNM